MVQAEKFGAHLTSPCAATSLREEAGHLVVGLTDGTEVAGRAVIVATGARYRRLDVDRLADFEGNGVYYAATEIEARECAASPVVVVGGGNSAGQAAVFLAESGSPVTVVIRGADLSAEHVPLSRRPDRGPRPHRGASQQQRSPASTATQTLTLGPRRRRGRRRDAVLRRAVLVHRRRSGLASGCRGAPRSTTTASCSPTDRSRPSISTSGGTRSAGDRFRSRRAIPGCSPSATSAAGSTKRVAAAVGEGSAAVRSVHEYLAFARVDR